jgi:hypothetical protein
MMEAVRTSETSVDNNFTRQYIPEDNSEHQRIFGLPAVCSLKTTNVSGITYDDGDRDGHRNVGGF